MIGSPEIDRRWVIAGAFAPLPVVGAAIALGWPWWSALVPLGALVAAAAGCAGRFAGLASALVATAGMALIVERARHPHHPHNGPELGALAVLLMVVAVSGANHPSPPPDQENPSCP